MDTAEKPSAASLRAGTLPDPRRIHVRYTRAGLLTAASSLYLTFTGFPKGIREKAKPTQQRHCAGFTPASLFTGNNLPTPVYHQIYVVSL